MKTLITAAVGTVALMSGAAYAEGCNYGSHASADTAKTPLIAALEEAEADRLEKLQSIEDQAAVEILIESPIIHN